jgi:cell wall-associated NlpC family hydrolase
LSARRALPTHALRSFSLSPLAGRHAATREHRPARASIAAAVVGAVVCSGVALAVPFATGTAAASVAAAPSLPPDAVTATTASSTHPQPSSSPTAEPTSSEPTRSSTAAAAQPSALTIHIPAHRKVSRGTRVHIYARVLRDGHARAGSRVRFYRRSPVRSAHRSSSHRLRWHYVGHARTNKRGFAHISWFVRHHHDWRARVIPAHGSAVTSRTEQIRLRSLGESAVRVARTRAGDPYVYGADGPTRFDCSGLTRWVFARLGHHLVHSSSGQYSQVRHIAKQHKRVGDLLFFYGDGGIYHVAIYAGHGTMWHAPHTGDHVRRQQIYTSHYLVGRV